MPEDSNENDSSGIPPERMQEVCEAIYAGRKIPAIKIYRELTGYGLKEAKDFVEGITVRLRAETPERFSTPTGGCGTVLIAIVVAAIIVYNLVPGIFF